MGARMVTILMAAVLTISLMPSMAVAADLPTAQQGATPQASATPLTNATARGSALLSTQAKKLKESQTALGLFKHIRDHSTPGSAEYVDAQCAIDILMGTVTSGVDYPYDQGPEQDGSSTATNGASNANAYKKVKLTNPNDAAALKNVDASLDFIDEYNAYRAKENKAEGTKLATNVGTNCRMMAISIVQCDWSKATAAHSRAFNVGENLAWGYSRKSPFAGWYTEEKANYKKRNGGQTGHYLNIVDYYTDTTVTGFATTANGALYGICHEQSFSSGSSWSPINAVYTTSEFRAKWFDGYYLAQGGKLKNPAKASAKKATVTVKARALKKAAKLVSNLSVANAKGKVTYKNVSTNAKAKRFKVTSKGKVKVTKGLKKGKYKVVVQVNAKGNSSYRSATVKVPFTVRVK